MNHTREKKHSTYIHIHVLNIFDLKIKEDKEIKLN